MTQQQGWGQPPSGPGWEQPPPGPQPPPPPGGPPPGGQPPPWGAPPPAGGSGWGSKVCPSCRSTIDARAVDCPRCGVRQSDAVYEEPKNRPIAILLALLLGGFGIHRFYVGPIAWGVAYLIFFWTAIPQFLAWLEAIYWLTRSDEQWAATYGGPVQPSNGLALGCLWIVALLPIIAIVLLVASLLGLIALSGEIAEILAEIEESLATPVP